MLDQWERDSRGRIDQIARALGDIRPSQLSDPKLFDFLALGRDGGDDAMPDAHAWLAGEPHDDRTRDDRGEASQPKIGRASGRERVCQDVEISGGAGKGKKKERRSKKKRRNI